MELKSVLNMKISAQNLLLIEPNGIEIFYIVHIFIVFILLLIEPNGIEIIEKAQR